MARKLADWLSGYIEYAENTECPLSYHVWTGLSVIGGALERKVYMQWGHSTIYPNMYIVLVGPAGASRKGEALNVGRPFLSAINCKVASQRIIHEALIQSIKDNTHNFKDGDSGVLKWQAPVSIFAAELSVFLGQKDIKFLADLTDWYDSADKWTYETKHQGTDEIQGVCVNLLGGTAPDWLQSILPTEAIGGGWTSRVIFVVEEYKGKIVADPTLSPPNRDLEEKLIHDLEDIHALSGEMAFSPAAKDAYVSWYEKQERGIKRGHFPIADPKFHSYVARRATHIKKISMALSASRGDSMIMELEDFERARTLLLAVEKKMPRAFSGLGRSKFADITDSVRRFIQFKKKTTRQEILRNFYRDIDSWTLEQVELVLERAKMIRRVVILKEDDVEYHWLDRKEASEEDPPTRPLAPE